MIHVYHGDGKGKTTAACGLAMRAAGHGKSVLFAQFFKDGSSGEVTAMKSVKNIETRCPRYCPGRWKTLSEDEKANVRRCCGEYLSGIVRDAGSFDLIVLDEAVSAYNHAAFAPAALLELLRREGKRREIVLTGRNPAAELLELAGYVTEMRKEKHPFDFGIPAREGVEY